MEQSRSLYSTIATLLRDAVHRALEQKERTSSDIGQVIVWLVGLASAFLALAVANPGRVETLAGRDYGLLAALLLLSVAAGVVCRIVVLVRVGKLENFLFQFGVTLSVFSVVTSVKLPEQLSDRWEPDEIVRRLREDFGVDYTFLLTQRVPIEGCRAAYRGQYETWQRLEVQLERRLKEVVGAYAGLSKARTERLFDSSPNLNAVRRRAYLIQALHTIESILFVVAWLSFVGGMFLVARGLWRTVT